MNRLRLTLAFSAVLHAGAILFLIQSGAHQKTPAPGFLPTGPSGASFSVVAPDLPKNRPALPAEKAPTNSQNAPAPIETAGAPVGDGGDSRTAVLGYFSKLRERIQKKLAYPSSLRDRRIQGQVEIEISVDPSGRLEKAQVIESSGSAALDRVALESAQNSAPFEPFTGNQPRSARIPIDFSIRSR
jgi:protein TonB